MKTKEKVERETSEKSFSFLTFVGSSVARNPVNNPYCVARETEQLAGGMYFFAKRAYAKRRTGHRTSTHPPTHPIELIYKAFELHDL